ncbi:uncharacterized protein CCR75_001935 [Bremia lactucae]|uniref:Uncharacterized protein n=1 Tax=Bremia lactucae TaxID=4779 RepID=A0A976IGT9_BRELC|nr:hypothetical protein CCR75_001935 [Bremia lactucae]
MTGALTDDGTHLVAFSAIAYDETRHVVEALVIGIFGVRLQIRDMKLIVETNSRRNKSVTTSLENLLLVIDKAKSIAGICGRSSRVMSSNARRL